MQARGCESVTQDVMAEVISPAGAKFLRKLSFNSWHTVPERHTLPERHTVPERRTDRAREHSCPQSNPAVSLNLCHRGSTKNDPESNSKESQQVEASNRSRKTRKRILYLCMQIIFIVSMINFSIHLFLKGSSSKNAVSL